jgi:ketosteroid isomerase-like protein
MTSEVDEFLAEMLPRQLAAERALHEGDAQPRMETWSHSGPVTLFGASMPMRSGWGDVSQAFHTVASWFSDLRDYRFEVMAAGASGGLAYTIGLEHSTVSVNGKPMAYTLRVTHVYRREQGAWKIVHRHGDYPPKDPH